jgi:hypothetical protein
LSGRLGIFGRGRFQLVGAGFKHAKPIDFLCFRGRLGEGGSVSGGTFECVDTGNGALPKMEAWIVFRTLETVAPSNDSTYDVGTDAP